MKKRIPSNLVAILVAAILTGCTKSETADSIFINGIVWTGVESQEFVEAIAVSANEIVATGTNSEIRSLEGENTDVIDLGGRLVTPGFIDNHTHFAEMSALAGAVDLSGVKTEQDFIRTIEEFAAGLAPDTWILHGIWDHEAWGGELPEAAWIDSFTSEHPLFLQRTDGHMALANSAAMRLAGINENTADVPGGEIVRDDEGRPTGILKDTAMGLVGSVIPPMSRDEQVALLRKGVEKALSLGVTQIHDMGTWGHLASFRQLRAAGELKLRVYSFVPINTHKKLSEYVAAHGWGDDKHRWGGLKGLVDGSLGSSTAWFYEDYNDAPGQSGFPLEDLNTFGKWIREGDEAGFQVTIHAIGDRANDWLLDTFQSIDEESPGGAKRRWRIEHAQHLSQSAIARIGEMGVIPSMQPYHAIDDGRWAESRIGEERLQGTYAFKSLSNEDAVVSFGSDTPVAPISVLQGIYAAVTRRTLNGEHSGGWIPDEKISVGQALRNYTVNNAYAGLQEDRLGKLAPGFLADFVVLDSNIFEISQDAIRDVIVHTTVVDGVVVYRRD